ncbi:MAG: efflux RND transporter periplasmic adaptor subunit [Acidobacteriota bacterium]
MRRTAELYGARRGDSGEMQRATVEKRPAAQIRWAATDGFRAHPAFSLVAWAAFIASLLVLHACSGSSKSAPRQEGMSAGVPVTVATVVQKPVPAQVRAIANVEAYSTVLIKTRVAGELTRVHFEEGDDVARGDPLFTIDPRPFELALEVAAADLERDKARARKADEDVQRYADLLKKRYASQEMYDRTRTDAEAMRATVKADEAAVENARLQLSYCTIYAPISGRTGSLLVHAGNQIKANDDKGLVVIHQIRPIYVSFAVPQRHLSEIRKHWSAGRLKVEAVVPGNDSPPLMGKLTFVDNAVDEQTGTIRLKATFPNDDKALWPGAFVNVTLTLSIQPDAIVVPTRAIQTGQQGQYVFVVKPDMTAENRPVVVTSTGETESAIEKGVSPGERVVTDGQLRLVPGSKLEIKSE